MKRCPNCSQSFSDDDVFCLNDGSVLETTSALSYSGDIPTQIISSFPPSGAVAKPEPNKSFYLIIGAMAAVIIGLAAIVFFLMSGAKGGESGQNNAVEAKNAVVAQNSTSPEKQNKTPANEKTPVPDLPIAETDAQSLISRWEQAQDAKNFNAYRACYASQQFLGIKRTNEGGREQKNYGQWMAERQRMLRNTIDVEVENLNITIKDGTAIAEFIQKFNSVRYCDRGLKELRIKMFPEGAKIIYEEMKTSEKCF